MDDLALLQLFYENTAMKDAVHSFIIHALKAQALADLIEKKDATALPLALDGVNKAFSELEDNFKPRKEHKIKSRAR